MDDRRHQLVEAVDIEVEDAVEVQEVDPQVELVVHPI